MVVRGGRAKSSSIRTGGSFKADFGLSGAVIPVTGRVPRSLRFVQGVALGYVGTNTSHWEELMVKASATFLLAVLLSAPLFAQAPEGIWQGYDGEWKHVSKQLVALAEATPAEKFAWRPAPGVRSTSEVYMHIAFANFYLLSVTGPKMPADLKSPDLEKTVTAKTDVIDWLKRSLEAVKTARAALKPADLDRKVKI